MFNKCFKHFNLNTFWDDSDYFTNTIPVTKKMINNAEAMLGYKLPKAYIELLKTKNGGTPKNTCFPTKTPTTWADNHVAISSICGVDGTWGIDSAELGSKFMIEEWGYPDIGIVVCGCPSGEIGKFSTFIYLIIS